MLKLVLRDSEWLRGEGSDNSSLLRVWDGKRCCIGILSRDCGISDELLLGKAELLSGDDLTNAALQKPNVAWLIGYSDTCKDSELMALNDDPLLSDEMRLEKMRPIFAEHGIEVEFVKDGDS